MPDFTEKYPVELIPDGSGGLTLVPCNDKANELLAAFFTSYGSNTTVAITAPSAERDGYGQSNDPYNSIKFATS